MLGSFLSTWEVYQNFAFLISCYFYLIINIFVMVFWCFSHFRNRPSCKTRVQFLVKGEGQYAGPSLDSTHSPHFETRKPRPLRLVLLASVPRLAERQSLGLRCQLPPRFTLCEPSTEPLGSTTGPAPYSFAHKSQHHSHTLPCMSCKPQALAFLPPTGLVSLREFRL
jgi:hypothetical protein